MGIKRPKNETYEKLLTCPYCGYRDDDSWELGDEDDNHQCESCEKRFAYRREITVEYEAWTLEYDEQ